MKKITCTILCFSVLFIYVTASAQWIQVSSPANLNWNVIEQSSTGALFLANSIPFPGQGAIYKSDDSAATWYNVANYVRGFSDIVFLTPNSGLAIPQMRDTIFKTSDGGNTWQQQYSPNCYGYGYGFPNVFFTDSLTGYAPGYATSDGGNSWTLQNQSLNMFPYVPREIVFLNDSTGIVVGNSYWSVIFMTTDRGITWSPATLPPASWELYSVCFPTTQIGYCTGNKYQLPYHQAEILKTTDGGYSWSRIYVDTPFVFYASVFCTDQNTCYAAGNGGKILKTTDGGLTWAPQNSGTNQMLRKIFFTDTNTGYIVGDSGTILKTVNAGGPVGISQGKRVDNGISVYPNPFGDEMNIQNNSLQMLHVELYNSMGEKLIAETFMDRAKTISTSSLAGGIYFLKIISGNQKIISKIVKL